MLSFSGFLAEAAAIIDVRHDGKSPTKFYGNGKESGYISPSQGLYFAYSRGNLVVGSTLNNFYDADVTYGSKRGKYGVQVNFPDETTRRAISGTWNQFGGKVEFASKTITIGKDSTRDGMRQRTATDIQSDQKAIRELFRYGVDETYKIKGLSNGTMTVKEFLSLADPTDQVLKGSPGTFYHGTSLSRWEKIKRFGLRPGQTGDAYIDLVPGYSEHNVYLATTKKTAEFYGKRQAVKDRDDSYVIIEITGLGGDRFLPDDRYVKSYDKDANLSINIGSGGYRMSGRELGEYAYRGIILPSKFKSAKIFKAR